MTNHSKTLTKSMSIRKPHNDVVGYVCEMKNKTTQGWVVIYDKNKGFDCDTDDRYVIVCELHHCFTATTSMPKAREIMKAVDFCEECMQVSSPNRKERL